jgi:hypothetical protein
MLNGALGNGQATADSPSLSTAAHLTVRDLRRRWKPAKERLAAAVPNHPTAVRVHRAFSWLARVEGTADTPDLDLALICRWIAFNALYGQWNDHKKEPMPDRDSWRRFLDQVLAIDHEQKLAATLVTQKDGVLALLEDEYLSNFFWKEPNAVNAGKAKRTKFAAHSWFLERRWPTILDQLVERIYVMRCQLVHGAATFGGKLNRDSLDRSATMLEHLVEAALLVIIDHGADVDWGAMCYPPMHELAPRPR